MAWLVLVPLRASSAYNVSPTHLPARPQCPHDACDTCSWNTIAFCPVAVSQTPWRSAQNQQTGPRGCVSASVLKGTAAS